MLSLFDAISLPDHLARISLTVMPHPGNRDQSSPINNDHKTICSHVGEAYGPETGERRRHFDSARGSREENGRRQRRQSSEPATFRVGDPDSSPPGPTSSDCGTRSSYTQTTPDLSSTDTEPFLPQVIALYLQLNRVIAGLCVRRGTEDFPLVPLIRFIAQPLNFWEIPSRLTVRHRVQSQSSMRFFKPFRHWKDVGFASSGSHHCRQRAPTPPSG